MRAKKIRRVMGITAPEIHKPTNQPTNEDDYMPALPSKQQVALTFGGDAPLTNGQQATMSTREIAELIEKRHDHIKVSADRLAAKGLNRLT